MSFERDEVECWEESHTPDMAALLDGAPPEAKWAGIFLAHPERFYRFLDWLLTGSPDAAPLLRKAKLTRALCNPKMIGRRAVLLCAIVRPELLDGRSLNELSKLCGFRNHTAMVKTKAAFAAAFSYRPAPPASR